MEPILERCVFEDMPANLWALKRRVEGLPVRRCAQGARPAAARGLLLGARAVAPDSSEAAALLSVSTP